ANRRSSGGSCGCTVSDQPITAVTGLVHCSPLWLGIKGLIAGPSASAGALVLPTHNPVFRICIQGILPQNTPGGGDCENGNASQSSFSGLMNRDGSMLAAMLGT